MSDFYHHIITNCGNCSFLNYEEYSGRAACCLDSTISDDDLDNAINNRYVCDLCPMEGELYIVAGPNYKMDIFKLFEKGIII